MCNKIETPRRPTQLKPSCDTDFCNCAHEPQTSSTLNRRTQSERGLGFCGLEGLGGEQADTFEKPCLLVGSADIGCSNPSKTDPEAKPYILRAQTPVLRWLFAQLFRANPFLENCAIMQKRENTGTRPLRARNQNNCLQQGCTSTYHEATSSCKLFRAFSVWQLSRASLKQTCKASL